VRTSRLTLLTLPAALLLALSLSAGCGRKGAPPAQSIARAANEFSVMDYNLCRYSLADRDGDGQKNDPKPSLEHDAVIELIATAQPDILAVQEIGSPSVFEEFRYALRNAGLDYEHVEYLQRGQSEINLAVLSRFPIVARHPHTDDTYSIGDAEISVLRGFLDVEIQVTPTYRFRLMDAHLKSKVFHTLGQTEMRRNEARLLNKHIRKILKESPEENLLVLGDFNDTYRSAPLREITGSKHEYLQDLRPRDEAGNVWTHFSPDIDQYDRIDYTLVSHGMRPEVVIEKTRVLSDPRTYQASDHRPLIVVFRDSDTPATPLDEPVNEPATPHQADETD
jgi:endonuclease/exonuclease/phosphatase family metal-dependent hydrolase